MPCPDLRKGKELLEFQGGTGRVLLRLRALHMGADLCLLLDGGDRPHTGAVAVATVSAEAADAEPAHAVPCITLPRHREDMLARRLAARVCEALGVTVTVLCGIHIHSISRAEIAQVDVEADALITAFLQAHTPIHTPIHTKDIPC